jgi:steroid delta-isomerase-like uncharacterized protein
VDVPQTKPANDDVRGLILFFDDQVFNKKNYDVIEHMIGEPYLNHDPVPGQPDGKEGIRQWARDIHHAFPDWYLDNEFTIVEGDRVAHRITWSGTFTNDYLGFKANGKKIVARSIDINRWKDGKMVERWSLFDTTSFMRQLAGEAV